LDKFNHFQNTMTPIRELRDNALRERHWKALRFEVKEDIVENSEEFNLEKVFALNLLSHAEKVSELYSQAKSQLKIETNLAEIKRIWEEDPQTNLEIVQAKSKHDNEDFFKLDRTDVIMGLIEEHT